MDSEINKQQKQPSEQGSEDSEEESVAPLTEVKQKVS